MRIKDSAFILNHGNTLDFFAGVFSCCAGLLSFLGFASLVIIFKPQTVGEVIKGSIGLLLGFGFASAWFLVGLKLICGPGGVKIDVNQKTVCVWRRTFFLNKKQRVFKFEQVKHIKTAVRKKPGRFGPDFDVFSVLAGDEQNEVELCYFSTISEAKKLALRVTELSGLPLSE